MDDDLIDKTIMRVANAIRYHDLEVAKSILNEIEPPDRQLVEIAARLLASKCD